MATAVTIVSSGGLPVTNIDTAGALGVALTPVAAGGVPITLVSSGGLPATLVSETGSLFYGLGGVQPLHYWDFTTNRAMFAGNDVGAVASTPGWSFTRATVGTAETLAGEIVQFGSGELRRTDRGVLIEGARTNLFLNSATGVTQGVVVTAVAHTLSFRGTGTITLSGASTAGPLVGTGVNDRVTLTFTPSAATLTLTVTGSVTNVQLEVGAFASSWIPTAGASVTRDAEILTVVPASVTTPMSLWAEIERVVDTGGSEVCVRVDNGGGTEIVGLVVSSTDLAQANMATGGVSQGNVGAGGAIVTGSTAKLASSHATNRIQACRDGVLGTEDTVATTPTGLTTLRIGANSTSTAQPWGYLKRVAVFDSALNDAQLQTITT